MRNPQDRHNGLINHLANSITSPQFERLKQLSRGFYIQPTELEDLNIRGFLNALEENGHIGVGRYEILKRLLAGSLDVRLVKDVEEAEAEIKAMKRTDVDLKWRWLDIPLSIRYMEKWKFRYGDTGLDVRREQPLPRVLNNERVTSWNASDSEHGELLKTAVCGQWAFSIVEPGQREWRGHKAVIDVETVEEVLGDHARKRKQTVQETLASIPDVPKNSLFILNIMKRPDLKRKWEPLLSGECFPDSKVLLIEGGDGKAVPQGAVKRNTKQDYNLDAIETACKAFPREPGIVNVFPAYKANEQRPPFIAVLVSIAFCGDKMTKYEGFTVDYYSWDMPDMEAQRALFSREAEENPIPPEKSVEIGQAIQNESEDLFNKHRNLTIISASPVKVTGGKITCMPCIVLYCRAKGVVPLGDSLFPKSIEGIPVDVREGFVSLSMDNGNPQNPEQEHLGQNQTFYSDPLRVGCSIGPENVKRSGTLGMFVQCEQTLCFLTCYHVLHFLIDAPCKKGVKVCQPSDADQEKNIEFRQDLASRDKSRVCGVVRDFRFGNFSIDNQPYGIDVALVEICGRGTCGMPAGVALQTLRNLHLEENELSFNNACLGSDKDLSSHIMFKCGRSTGLTRGMVKFINGVVCRPEIVQYDAEQAGAPILCNELLSSMAEVCGPKTGNDDHDSFAERGDSGAAVFYLKDGKPHIVGIVVAKTTYSAALMSPIWPILKLFNIELARIEEDMIV